ncbi:MAG: thermonuclease family protein [Ignavibacteriae bacterium]|nr:thermonuclease family protein [Ignavibacteria bacterium]MBI3364301.1 thermonuclease family protein [Ignavibacteriota bacterium]
MKTTHKIIIGDSRQMDDVLDESVHLVVTSPPYWQLKDYGHQDQIGFNDTYEDYINNLNLVWNECFRVLHPGCRLCINIGDQFARSVYYGRYKVIPIRTEIIKFCEIIGFDYMGAIIWQKVTTTNTTGGATVMGSFPFPRNGIIKIDYEFILIFKKLGEPPRPSKEAKELSKLTTSEWNEYFTGHWNFGGERQDKHLAMFPEELPKRLIRMFTFVEDSVLDPFLGSGTTSLAAKNLARNSVGYEINAEFLPHIQEKLGITPLGLTTDQATFEIRVRNQESKDFSSKINELPYIFRDKVRFDKKVDPKKLQFGSKIDGSQTRRENYFTVKKIISPEVVELGNGLLVRLLGVKAIPGREEEATRFLQESTKGQRVFLKFDNIKYDDEGRPLVYLYLKNKTFLNAHLVKQGLALADDSNEHRLKDRFKTLSLERTQSK